MEPTEGARTFHTSGDAYDLFMGRYSHPLASVFVAAAEVAVGDRVLDVGCGPGALTGVLVDRVGSSLVAATDPSPPFVAECARRFPGVDVRVGRAEEIPFDDAVFDCAMSQLVLHFVSDADQALRELRRVVRPGGTIAACVWDFEDEMEMLRHFWDAAVEVEATAPGEGRLLRLGRRGELAELFRSAGLEGVVETTLEVATTYRDFDELWAGFLAGIGPAGSFCVSLTDAQRDVLRQELFRRVGEPDGPFTLGATARCVTGRLPAAASTH
jgi:ubiquinone/menaquinone biosynthesis C-methylase UbiE